MKASCERFGRCILPAEPFVCSLAPAAALSSSCALAGARHLQKHYCSPECMPIRRPTLQAAGCDETGLVGWSSSP